MAKTEKGHGNGVIDPRRSCLLTYNTPSQEMVLDHVNTEIIFYTSIMFAITQSLKNELRVFYFTMPLVG